MSFIFATARTVTVRVTRWLLPRSPATSRARMIHHLIVILAILAYFYLLPLLQS